MKSRWGMALLALWGLLIGIIFIHEGVHWVQEYNIPNKEICFMGKMVAYLDFYGDVYPYETKEQKAKEEAEACIISGSIGILGMIYFIKNIKCFFYENLPDKPKV